MKKIVNKLRFALLLGFVAMSVTAWSQAVPYVNKMSITTQMFLDDMSSSSALLKAKAEGQNVQWDRLYAAPETRDGKTYIAAFVRVNDDNTIRELESLGVEVQSQFKNGTLLSTAIPVDVLDELAALEGVTRVNVSPVVQLETKQARQATNADDVLTLSSDAQTAGLTSAFDGTGVILGVIDTGIDFNHTAFKDANGNSRVKRAYIYTGTSGQEYTSVSGLTTDNTGSDHGTHTASTAGGSSVTGSYSYTVTTDHANATYGGMAPGADLYLAGASTTVTGIANAFSLMQQYAQSEGKPLVVNNSWSMPYGPHDGTGDFADVVSDIFNDNNPGYICLFASANNANLSSSTDNGGFFVTGTATSSSPLGTIMRNESSGGNSYSGYIADAWCRTTGLDMGCTVYVLNNSTGAIVATVPVNFGSTGTTGTTVNVSSYYSGTLTAYKDYVTTSNGKTEILLQASSLSSRSSGAYTLAVEFYPTSGSSIIDVWAGSSSSYLSGHLTTSGHTWTSGTDDMSVNNTATLNNVISVGSYVTRTQSGSNSVGDISDFSGYATADKGPQGIAYPWITAPGEVIYSALNTQSGSSSYGGLSGTSQATPVATGIVAQWLQAAKSVGKTLTTSEVKNIMAQTAVKDSYVTSGSNASHFGPNGKIDALAGVQYILNNYASPTIAPSETQVALKAALGGSSTTTITVNGFGLTGNITATLTDESGAFSISKATTSNMLTATSTVTLTAGDELAVTYAPTTEGTHNATLTLSSTGAETVTIPLSGTTTSGTTTTEELLVCDGSDRSYTLPTYHAEYYYQVNQMIYPESMLADMVGKNISGLKFYPNDGASTTFSGIYSVSLGTTSQESFANSNPAQLTGLTAVVTRKTATSGEAVFEIEFDEPFTYDGDNLVVQFQVNSPAPGSWNSFYWAGTNQTNYQGFYSSGSSAADSYSYRYAQQFLPKTTFIYSGESQPYAVKVSPQSLDFGKITPNSETTLDVTVTNKGSNAFTPALSGLTAPFSTTYQPASLAAGESVTIPVKFRPTSVGDYNGTLHIGAAESEASAISADVTMTGVCGNDITVCDGTATENHLPLFGQWYDNAQMNQMIYPADQLESIAGKKIKSITFYPSSTINFGGGNIEVSMGTTSQSSYSSPVRITGLTTVATGYAVTQGSTELKVNFDEGVDFTYDGENNLVIEFHKTTSEYTAWHDDSFVGVTTDNSASFYSRGSSLNNNGVYSSGSSVLSFLPKVTFELEEDATPTVETPVIAPADGSEFSTAPQEVTITCGTSGATIHYSTDGGNTYNDYTGAFNISGNTTVMAYATAADMNDSQTATATYTFKPEAPVISPASGSLLEGQQVSITCPTSDATIYYSINGGSYQVYTAPFSMSGNGTVSAYAAVSGWTNSETVTATYTIAYPSLTVNPTSVSIEDGTGDARTSAAITVTSENVSGEYSTSASTNWTASMLRSNASMALTYNGKALHQVGVGSVSQGGLTASVNAEYLYTGPIYVIGDVNNYAWNTNYGAQLTRDENGFYTGVITTQVSNDAAYIIFTKRLGDDTSYRFGPVSNGNWWLTSETEDVYAPIDTVGNLNNIRLAAGTWFVTIDSYNNQFKIRQANISGYVDNTSVDFGEKTIGTSSTMIVRIHNNGDVAFTPELNLSGLNGTPFTVTGNGEVAPGGYIDLVVTFSPESEGTYSNAFTVTINGQSTTVNLSGSAVTGGSGGEGDDTGLVTTIRDRSSNIVTVPVYKTDMEVYGRYTQAQVDANDENVPTLTPNLTNSQMVQVDSKRPTAINGYHLYHNPATAANTTSDTNWAVDEHKVSFSIHDKVSSSYLPYDLQGSGFVQRPVTLFPARSYVVNDIWVDHIDYVEVENEDTYYVPVIAANGKVTPNNTYGSPIEESPLGSLELSVSYSKTNDADENGNIWMTAGGTLVGYAPALVEDGHHYTGYGYRVWRVVNGGTPIKMFEVLNTTESVVTFGSPQFPFNGKTYELDENSFQVPADATVEYIGRFYYYREENTTNAPMHRVAEEVEGLENSQSDIRFYVIQADGSSSFTSVYELGATKEVVDVTYVNPLGMTSSQPFEGVNIIVTRYSDGTTSTVKVLK